MKLINFNNYKFIGNNTKTGCSNYLKISIILIIFFSFQFERLFFRKNVFHVSIKERNEIIDEIKVKKFNQTFEYHNYERELITKKIQELAGYEQNHNEPYFLNGIIRKFKPKKCLEIGVAAGGSAIIILNALKNINNSFLISMDLRNHYYRNKSLPAGFAVKKYFPELAVNKWQLFTGSQPHIFLDKLNLKFDFVFLDTVHLTPGELINIIEVLPFLEDNAIIVLHDIVFHLPSNKYYNPKSVKFHPSQIYLMTALVGDKIIIPCKDKGIENIGAVILYPNQEKYYLNYFLLLLTPWDYFPQQSYIDELNIFVKKYYKNDVLINIFNRSVEENRIYVQKHQKIFGIL